MRAGTNTNDQCMFHCDPSTPGMTNALACVPARGDCLKVWSMLCASTKPVDACYGACEMQPKLFLLVRKTFGCILGACKTHQRNRFPQSTRPLGAFLVVWKRIWERPVRAFVLQT